MRRIIIAGFLASVLAIGSLASVLAANPVVTLGQDLTTSQRRAMLRELDVRSETQRIYIITNSQEHALLAGIAPAKEIGTRAISCAYVIPEHVGYGIRVSTHDITWVTPAMYANALATAGVANASVHVAAPFPVSGTAALAGILWAYQSSTGAQIPYFQKRTAARELVITANLAHRIGHANRTTTFMETIKQQVASGHLTNPGQIRPLIIKAAAQAHIALTSTEINQITAVMVSIGRLQLSAAKLHQQIGGMQTEADQARGVWSRLVAFFQWIWSLITGRGSPGAVDGPALQSIDFKRL